MAELAEETGFTPAGPDGSRQPGGSGSPVDIGGPGMIRGVRARIAAAPAGDLDLAVVTAVAVVAVAGDQAH